MFINLQHFKTLYDDITSAISGQYEGIFKSKAEEVRPFAESPKLKEEQINEAFDNVIPNDQKEALAEPLEGSLKMRPLPFFPSKRLNVMHGEGEVVDSSKPKQLEEISKKKTLNSPNPVMTTMGSVNFEEADPPMQNSIIPEYLKPTVGKSVSPNAQPDKPSAFDKFVDGVTRIMDSQGTVLLTPDSWNWLTREEQKKDTRIDPNMVGEEPAPFLIPLGQAQSVLLPPLSSIQEEGFVPLSSIREEDKLNSAIHQQNIKKLTQGIKKSIISKLDEIDVNEYQEEVAKKYLSDLTKVNPILIEICKEIFKERFKNELEIPNNYEADASSAITSSYPVATNQKYYKGESEPFPILNGIGQAQSVLLPPLSSIQGGLLQQDQGGLALQYSIEVGGSPLETSRAVGEAVYQRPLPPPPLESIVPSEVGSNSISSTNMNTNSGNVNNKKPSIISGLLGAMSSLSSGLSYLYLRFQEKTRKTQDASSGVKNEKVVKNQISEVSTDLALTSKEGKEDPSTLQVPLDEHDGPQRREREQLGLTSDSKPGPPHLPPTRIISMRKSLVLGDAWWTSVTKPGLASVNHEAGTKITQRSEAFNAVVPKSSLHNKTNKRDSDESPVNTSAQQVSPDPQQNHLP